MWIGGLTNKVKPSVLRPIRGSVLTIAGVALLGKAGATVPAVALSGGAPAIVLVLLVTRRKE